MQLEFRITLEELAHSLDHTLKVFSLLMLKAGMYGSLTTKKVYSEGNKNLTLHFSIIILIGLTTLLLASNLKDPCRETSQLETITNSAGDSIFMQIL